MKLNHFQKKITTIKFFTIVLFTFAHPFIKDAFSSKYYSSSRLDFVGSGFHYRDNRYYNPLSGLFNYILTTGIQLSFIVTDIFYGISLKLLNNTTCRF